MFRVEGANVLVDGAVGDRVVGGNVAGAGVLGAGVTGFMKMEPVF